MKSVWNNTTFPYTFFPKKKKKNDETIHSPRKLKGVHVLSSSLKTQIKCNQHNE